MNQIISRTDALGSQVVEVRAPKTYATHERACRYGQVRGASPIEMLDGSQRWIALPFYKGDGRIYAYKEVA